jgi:hypothetical protein
LRPFGILVAAEPGTGQRPGNTRFTVFFVAHAEDSVADTADHAAQGAADGSADRAAHERTGDGPDAGTADNGRIAAELAADQLTAQHASGDTRGCRNRCSSDSTRSQRRASAGHACRSIGCGSRGCLCTCHPHACAESRYRGRTKEIAQGGNTAADASGNA